MFMSLLKPNLGWSDLSYKFCPIGRTADQISFWFLGPQQCPALSLKEPGQSGATESGAPLSDLLPHVQQPSSSSVLSSF